MGEDAAALKDMAAQLAAKLRVQVEKERKEWHQIRRKLAEVAAIASHDPTTAGQTAGQALLTVIKDASPPQAFMRSFEERLSKASPYLFKDLVLLVADELNMTPLCDSEPVYMLDKEWKFCKENVDHIINCSAELSAPNAPYSVVSIVGGQGSGKSYLLNCLFGTKFPEMDAKRRRLYGCTRGIMLSRCTGPSLLLLDVQGSDRTERGQDISLPQKAILFALTVSDIMIVNMSVSDIGRDHGAAETVFRAISEERTKLRSAGLTKILFVLRMYDGETPLGILRAEVPDMLQKVWESVNEEHVKLTDYIEVNIVVLPDRQPEEFSEEVTALRKLLSNNGSAKVPASSFSLSSRIFWDTIKQNKELDIPSHKVVIARLYCRQLVEDNLNNFLDSQKHLKAGESPECFKERLHELQRKITTEYDVKTKMYDPDVRDKQRRRMVEKLRMVTENWRKRVQPKAMSLSELVEVQKCIKIGLRCVEVNRVNRPTITEIVEELNMIDFHLVALSC